MGFGNFKGKVNDDGTWVQGTSPGFVDEAHQDYHLASTSTAIDRGIALNPLVLPDHDVLEQYVEHLTSEPRPRDATLDIGAFEFLSSP